MCFNNTGSRRNCDFIQFCILFLRSRIIKNAEIVSNSWCTSLIFSWVYVFVPKIKIIFVVWLIFSFIRLNYRGFCTTDPFFTEWIVLHDGKTSLKKWSILKKWWLRWFFLKAVYLKIHDTVSFHRIWFTICYFRLESWFSWYSSKNLTRQWNCHNSIYGGFAYSTSRYNFVRISDWKQILWFELLHVLRNTKLQGMNNKIPYKIY